MTPTTPMTPSSRPLSVLDYLQRQLDESYVQARAGYRPTANVSSSLSWSQRPGPGGGYDDSNSLGATLTASQPIYAGGRVSAAGRPWDA